MLGFLAFKSLKGRLFVGFLCTLTIALSLALFLLVEKLRIGIEEGFTNTISQADLIVGARSGPLQLLLYSVFHIGRPLNNIGYATYKEIQSHPMVEWSIPITLGDSYKGYRVVATNKNFKEHYRFREDRRMSLEMGNWGTGIFDIVLGSKVAKSLKHKIGDPIVLGHGISEVSVHKHDENPFTVSGILKTTGTPLDRAVFISLEGMEAIHKDLGEEENDDHDDDHDDHNDGHDHHKDHKHEKTSTRKEELQPKYMTSVILKTKNPVALLGFQRFLSSYKKEPLTAVIPAMALVELWRFLDQIELAFIGVSMLVIVVGLMSILISLYMSLNERKREMAILRAQGMSAYEITLLLLMESLFLSGIGIVLGILLQYGFVLGVRPFIESSYGIYLELIPPTWYELKVAGGILILGLFSGLIPAMKAYRISLHQGTAL